MLTFLLDEVRLLPVTRVKQKNSVPIFFVTYLCRFISQTVMADYFDEMGWEPLGAGQTPDHLLHLARLLRDFGMWEELGHGHKLPPCASKASIANLLEKEITVSGKQ